MTAQTDYSELMAIGFAGQVDPASNPQVKTMRNAEAVESMEFGIAVAYQDRTADGTLADLLTATSDIVPGILLHSYAYDSTELDAVGVVAGSTLNVLRSGRVLVLAEEAVDVGDPLFVRAVAVGAELQGALRMSADSTDCIDMTGRGQWDSVAGAGELAWLRVDFLNPVT